jgi:hypothetical protein
VKHLPGPAAGGVEIKILNDKREPEKLNHWWGADFVKTHISNKLSVSLTILSFDYAFLRDSYRNSARFLAQTVAQTSKLQDPSPNSQS